MDKLLFLIFFFLPAGLANSAPVLALKVPLLRDLSYPLDFNFKINNKRVLGDHKTIRGIILGVLAGIATVIIQKHLYQNFDMIKDFSEINYLDISSIYLGGLLGFGAVFGDSFKSFFKRRIDIKPGGPWIPFDQIDFIIGGILFSALYIQLSWSDYLAILLIFVALHFVTNGVAYLVNLKDVPY